MSSSSFLASFTFLEASLALFWAWFAFSKAVKADAPSDAATPSFSPNRSLVSESLFVRELAASESSFESCLLSVASTLTVSATSEASLEMVSALRATVRARFAEVSAPFNYNCMINYYMKAVYASEFIVHPITNLFVARFYLHCCHSLLSFGVGDTNHFINVINCSKSFFSFSFRIKEGLVEIWKERSI